MDRYIVFDVETPNHANSRMSAIGISVIENGCVTDSFFSYVNPEQPFDSFNIELTNSDTFVAFQMEKLSRALETDRTPDGHRDHS